MMAQKHIASVSWGKDSIAMLLLILQHPEEYPLDVVLFCNTGCEFSAIYRMRDAILPILSLHGVEYQELDISEEFLHSMLYRAIHSRQTGEVHRIGYGWCGGPCRWGTSLKIQALKRFYQNFFDTPIEYVGIAADEVGRLERQISGDGMKVYPLVEHGITEAQALEMCYQAGYTFQEKGAYGPVRLYDVVDRGSCWCCKNKNLNELKNMMYQLPDYYERLLELEDAIGEPMKGPGKSVKDLQKRFTREGQQLLFDFV